MKITTEDIQVGFHARQILKGISIESKDKELVGIIGPNGSGKSTLLKCIYRILKPDACYANIMNQLSIIGNGLFIIFIAFIF